MTLPGLLLTGILCQQSAFGDERTLSLHVLDCGVIHGMESAAFLPGVEDRPERLELVNRCYLVDHPDGTLLWDLGFPRTLYYRVLAGLFWLQNLGRSSIDVGEPLTDQLLALGFEPRDIDFVATSHMHFDHVGAANQFTSSTWLVQRKEHDWSLSDDLDVDYVDKDLYSGLAASPTTLLNGTHDVFGDGRVVILPSPGHTPGHQCLFVDLDRTGPIVLSGDLYHSALNRSLRVAPAFNTDREKTTDSMQVIEQFLADHGAELFIQHEPGSGPKTPAVLQ